jgi:hypothetical protein
MNEHELRQTVYHMQRWGFEVFDSWPGPGPGYLRLLVALRPEPTLEHFDPECLTLTFLDGQNIPHRTGITRETLIHGKVRVCPGHVAVSDRVNKRVEFYCYGGTLEVIEVNDVEQYRLLCFESEAPILALHSSLRQGMEDLLADSSEALVARMRAVWEDDTELLRRMEAMGSLQFFTGCIESLYHMYHEAPDLEATFAKLHSLIQKLHEYLHGRVSIRLRQQRVEELVNANVHQLNF